MIVPNRKWHHQSSFFVVTKKGEKYAASSLFLKGCPALEPTARPLLTLGNASLNGPVYSWWTSENVYPHCVHRPGSIKRGSQWRGGSTSFDGSETSLTRKLN